MRKIFFILLIMGLGLYSLFLIATPHYNYYAFKSDVAALMRISIDSPNEITENIMDFAETYNIPIEKSDIKLRLQKRYVVTISWEKTVDLFGIYQKTFEFYIDTSE